jgi:hypothetical protein
MSESKKSSSLERRVQSYFSPKNHTFFKALVKVEGFKSESEAINSVMSIYRKTYPAEKMQKIVTAINSQNK